VRGTQRKIEIFKAPACSGAFVQGAFFQALDDLIVAKSASATSAVRTKATDPRNRGSVATEAKADVSLTPQESYMTICQKIPTSATNAKVNRMVRR